MSGASPAPTAFSPETPAETVRGIGLVVVAYVLMTMGDVAGKWALLPAGLGGVMLGRGLAGCAVTAGLARVEGSWDRLRPLRWGLVLFRSALHAGVSLSWYAAWQVLSLADAYAVGFTAPLLMTLLAVPMLGERIRWRRAASTGIGFCGVLLMVRPGTALWQPQVAVLLPGIVGMAVSRIMTRSLSTTETPECLTFWLMLTHVPAGAAMLALGFGPAAGAALPGDALVALVLLGGLNASAHWLMARAYAAAPVSALAPYEYTTLIWGGLAAYAVWREVPDGGTLAGAAVVAAAGLYNLHRERVRAGTA